MYNREKLFPVFLLFVIISSVILFSSQKGLLNGPTGFFEKILIPIQSPVFSLFRPDKKLTREEKLERENKSLLSQLAKQKELEKENKALRDQFREEKIDSKTLLPARIIGLNSYFPGVSRADKIVVDRGEKEGLHEGNIVVYENNLVGKVVRVLPHASVVDLVNHKNFSFTAQTVNTAAPGVLKGKGDKMFLENVVLSDKLERDDIVVTKGDMDEKELGFPPDLIVGRIISVNKKTSDLFQTAQVDSLLDIEELKIVFVMVGR